MTDKTPEKFKNKMDLTFEQAFRMRFEIQVDITNAFVPIAGKEKAIKVVEKLYEKKAIESAKQMVIHSGDINNFADFKEFFMRQMNSDFYKNAITFTIIVDSETKLEFKITECLYAKVFKELDETEKGYRFYCKLDLVLAKIYHPNVKLTRTKTLMEGNECCKFTYTWEE